jgi:hypothetical protein
MSMILDFNVEVGLKLGMAVLGGLQLVSYDIYCFCFSTIVRLYFVAA